LVGCLPGSKATSLTLPSTPFVLTPMKQNQKSDLSTRWTPGRLAASRSDDGISSVPRRAVRSRGPVCVLNRVPSSRPAEFQCVALDSQNPVRGPPVCRAVRTADFPRIGLPGLHACVLLRA
jgi:hypothetical protein